MRALAGRVDAVLVQAVIAAALSFAHIHDLAAAAGQHGWKAWAYPVSVDLLLVAAWRRLRTGTAPVAGWCWFLIALTASLGANVATAGLLDLDQVPVWLRILVAGWPAVAFLGGTLLAHAHPTTPPAQLAVSAAEPAPTDTGGVVEVARADSPPASAEPEPEPEPTAVQVPEGLIAHARKVASDHHTRTGTPIDAETLRARLGVPPAMADALAARLT